MQYQTKLGVVLDLLVAHLDRSTSLDGVAADDGIENWIDGFFNVLNEHRFSHGDGALDHVQVVL